MNTRKKITTLMGGAAIAAASVAKTAGLAAASAAPSQSPGAVTNRMRTGKNVVDAVMAQQIRPTSR